MSAKVLVADDSKVIRAIITDMLRELAVPDIVEAADGNEAIDAFQRGKFDLIVLDWQMPGICGLEVIEAIRSAGSKVPILMVTATGTKPEHVMHAVEAGVTDYLLKPFAPDTLREKLSKYCRPSQSTGQPLDPAAAQA